MKPPIVISSNALTPFATALSLFTERGYEQKILQQPYSVIINQRQHSSAGAAYIALSVKLNLDAKFELVRELLEAKLSQKQFLMGAIAISGGIKWLRSCSYQSNRLSPKDFWQGKGYSSAYITALIVAYRQVDSQLRTANGF